MTTKTSRKPAKKTIADALDQAAITQTGKDATGQLKANIKFPDGQTGSVDYEVLRTQMVEQGKRNRRLLESLGYKVGLTCVAGLFGSAHYEKDGRPTLAIEGAKMNRIVRLLPNAQQEEVSILELAKEDR